MNLITNSVDAMPEGGMISISTRVQNEGVVMEVLDTGKGIYRSIGRCSCTLPYHNTGNIRSIPR